MTASDKSRRYATVMHPTIGAVLAGTYRFATEEQANQQLQIFRDHFVLSRHQNEESNEKGIILWIKGYSITAEEKKNGYTGNYAVIGIKKLKDGKYSLTATRLESELKFHPQRQRPKHKHPNWGHPILRSVKKKRIYPTVEAAQKELQLLHEEYPEVTIPLTNKLYLIIYSRQQTPPAQKYVLEVKVGEEGGFYIDAYANEYKAPKELPGADQAATMEGDETAEAPVAGGYFTSMVALKRSRKKPPMPASAPPASEEDVES
jgi:hypothetical protein